MSYLASEPADVEVVRASVVAALELTGHIRDRVARADQITRQVGDHRASALLSPLLENEIRHVGGHLRDALDALDAGALEGEA